MRSTDGWICSKCGRASTMRFHFPSGEGSVCPACLPTQTMLGGDDLVELLEEFLDNASARSISGPQIADDDWLLDWQGRVRDALNWRKRWE